MVYMTLVGMKYQPMLYPEFKVKRRVHRHNMKGATKKFHGDIC